MRKSAVLLGSLLLVVVLSSVGRADCNGNAVDDLEDIASGTSLDCNGNSIPDECEQSLLSIGQVGAPLPLSFTALRTAAADFDGDGALDILVLGSGNNPPLAVFINTMQRHGEEGGGFLEPDIYPSLDSLRELIATDLDGDGDVDIAASARSSLSLYWNDGAGKLSDPVLIPIELRLEGVTTGDVDSDGTADLVLLHRRDDALGILRGRGDHTFDPPRLVSLLPAGEDPRAIACADMDGDGDCDIVTANRATKNVLILRNDGSGGFPNRTSISFDEKADELAVGDLDGNGSLDLVVALNPNAVPPVILLNSGDGESFETSSFNVPSSEVGVGDADGDGDVDVFAWVARSELLSVLINDGAGRFHSKVDVGTGLPLSDMAPGDFDQDGDLDFAAAIVGGGLSLYRNGEGRSISMTSSTVILRNNRPPHTADMADLDGDGDLDFITGDGGNQTMSILINDGRGGFTIKSDSGTPTYINSIAARDFDGDGDMDVVVADPRRTQTVQVHLNRGDAVFQASTRLIGGGTPFYVTTADLGGGGRGDIIVANESSRSISVYLNHGNGPELFESRGTRIPVGNGPRGVTSGDFDQDGDVDLAVANTSSSSVTVLFNQGDGTFEESIEVRAKSSPFFVVSGDWNRDGFPDLATANHNQRSVGIFLNEGDGTFGEPELVDIGKRPYSMRPGDFDGDGFLDLATTNESESSASVLLNRGDGTFFVFGHYRTGSGPRFAPVGDVDGDGAVDIVSANRGGRTVTVLLNKASPRALEDFADRICTPLDFQKFAFRSGAGTQSVKYTMPARDDPSLLFPVFQNSRRYALHHEFLRSVFPDRFPGLTAPALIGLSQIRASRDYYIGSIERIDLDTGPLYVYSIVTSTSRDELLALEEVRGVHETLGAVFELLPLAYAPDLTGQSPLARQAAEAWTNPGFDIYLGTVDPPSDYIPYTQAVGYGRVRLFSEEAFDEANLTGRFTFQDIAVVSVAPRDIEGVVGGIITAAPQGALSHISIRTARRGTPNAFVSGAMEEFSAFEGKLVRLEVQATAYTVREATREEAEAFWAERPRLSQPRPFDAEYRQLDSFHEMDLALDAAVPAETRYGGKATGLARLQTILSGPYDEYRERGFAIPMAHYVDFMRGNTIPSLLDPDREVPYQEYLEELFALPEFQTDSERRFEALDAFRDFARDAGSLPDGLAEELSRKIQEVFGSTDVMVRFRSSSNVEDILQFNGAGLYESTSVCLADSLDADDIGPSHCDPEKASERTIARALKKVWTSLWTFRAHEERSFFQIPQLSATMGILVNRAFLDEAANGVAFTGDPTNPRGGCYLVTVQVGEESVVSPNPGVLPEVNLLEVAGGEVLGIVRALPSTLVAPGEVILSDEKLRELGALMWHIDQNYPLDTEGHPREDILLDLEFKLERDGSLAVKQVRPFLSAGEKSSRPTFRLEIPPDTIVCGRQSLVSPSGDPRDEYERKSVVRLREGVFELPASHCVFAADLVEEVIFGPGEERAVPEGSGLFRVDERSSAGAGRTVFSFDYRQFFSLPDGRQIEIDLVNLEFVVENGRAAQGRLILDEPFITFRLRMFGFLDDQTINYASCSYELLSEWDVNADLADGTRLRVRERFEPARDFTLTGPAAVEAAEVFIGGAHRFADDYWHLVYSSARHNTAVKYWILFDAPVTAPGVAAPVHAIEFAPADSPDVVDIVDVPQEESVAYLDENLEVLHRPEIIDYEKRKARRSSRTRFLRGDANADGSVSLGDALHILDYLFLRGAPFECASAADTNDDSRVNFGDAIHTLMHLFHGGPIAPPNQLCDRDPTRDQLDCDSFAGCF